MRAGFWWGSISARHHLKYINIDGRIILKCISKKWDGQFWTGLIWMRIGAGGGLL